MKSLPHSDPSHRDESILTLHVDDEPDIGELTETYLEELVADISVITETTASDGLEVLEREPVDCIISDYQMPGTDGVDFLRTVREEYPNLPFFLFTGKGSEAVASDAIDAGVTSYVQKGGPEVYEQLAHRIETAVDRRRSESRAKLARERILELYEQTDGFFTVDDDWRITYWNQVMADRTGYPPKEVLGESIWEVFSETVGTDAYDHYHEAMERREPIQFETEYEPYGYWIEARVFPVEGGLSVYARDITDKKEREIQMERRNKILESFANTVSHDLRSPLNVAEGRLQLAKETGEFEHLEEVAQAHNRMRNLIDELLRTARGENLESSEISLRETVQMAWDTVTSEEMTVEITTEAVFEAHESQVRRLFENLFWNALDHGDASRIRVGKLDGTGFYIEDDGEGIPPAHRTEVFDSGFSTDEDSPGYGLHIVEGVAETHDWDVSVTQGSDGGARFEIRGVTFLDE
jgi:PAS domain S-box-containing protein